MNKKINAVVVGSINMDLILGTDKAPEEGENVTGTAYSYANGGKGANQATALAKLGADVRMTGKVADDDNGRTLLKNLKNNNIDISGVATDGSVTGLAAIIIDGNGKNRIIVYEGANAEIDSAQAVASIDKNTQLLLIQFETAENVVCDVVNHAVKNNITTVIDCGPAKPFSLEKMQGADIISPNESETKALTGIFPDDEQSALEASRIIMERSKARFVVLKLGARGCSIWNGKEITFLPAYKSDVVDTTAAGDCFTAAMAVEYLNSRDILKACDMGNRAGAIAVSRFGAADSMPTLGEIISFGQ